MAMEEEERYRMFLQNCGRSVFRLFVKVNAEAQSDVKLWCICIFFILLFISYEM